MTRTHPKSLREALAYLRAKPDVCLTTRYAETICRSHWRYRGQTAGVIWFSPFLSGESKYRAADTGLELHGSEFEVALEFSRGGFQYTRGAVSIYVEYYMPKGGDA